MSATYRDRRWKMDEARWTMFYCTLQKLSAFCCIVNNMANMCSNLSSSFLNVFLSIYLQAKAKFSQVCVSAASCAASDSLLINTALYLCLRQLSARFVQIDLDDRLTWSVSEYFSSCGKNFDISNISIAASNARP